MRLPSAPSLRAIAAGVGQAALIVLAYLLAWHGAGVFEVHPNVSALYLSAGLTTAVAMRCGWKALPLAAAALFLVPALDRGLSALVEVHTAGALRQVVLYGGAGLYLRQRWRGADFRLSLNEALRFTLVAFVASFASAAIGLLLPPFDTLPAAARGEVFLSFWGGDCAGVLILVPLVAIGDAWLRSGDALVHRWHEAIARRRGEPGPTVLVLVAAAFATGFALPESPPGVGNGLVLLPVMIAGLKRGVLFGFAVALLVCAIELVPALLLGRPPGDVWVLQLHLIVAIATALFAGAAHDDKLLDWRNANFDALTGLANRNRFQDQIAHELLRARRSGQPLAVMYIDLDRFKAVNDALGHDAGDALLREVAGRLGGCVRASDTLARLGGDEFAAILPEPGSGEAVERVGRAMLAALARPIELDGGTARISASIGLALFPDDGEDAAALLRCADRAMYEAKRRGRNGLVRHAELGASRRAADAPPPAQGA